MDVLGGLERTPGEGQETASDEGGGTAVGLARIELATSALSVLRSNRLSYSPRVDGLGMLMRRRRPGRIDQGPLAIVNVHVEEQLVAAAVTGSVWPLPSASCVDVACSCHPAPLPGRASRTVITSAARTPAAS